MKLEKARSSRRFRQYVMAFGEIDGARIMASDQADRHFYYVLDDQKEPIGFAELDYKYGSAEASIQTIVLDQDVRAQVDYPALLELLADRARRMGARVVAVETRADPEPLARTGWSVEQTTHRLRRLL